LFPRFGKPAMDVAGFSGTRKSIVILSEAALAAERRIPPFGAPDGEILRRG